MAKNGIDVSEHQGTIDWQRVNVDFVIIRAGYGRYISQKDKCFENNYQRCKERNIPCGAYWYSYATSAEEAKTEAQVCLEVIRGKQFEYPIYFDIEEQRQLKLGMAACSEIAKAFLETVENAGYFVGIYSAKYNLETYISEEIRKRYAVWVAQYGVSSPTYSGAYGLWQKSNTGSVAGISGNVDLDESYVDYPAIIKARGLNGYPKPEPEKSEISVTITVDGKTYSGKLKEQ